MKRLALIITLLIVIILNYSFADSKKSFDKNSNHSTQAIPQIATVLTLEESLNNIKVPFTGNSFIGFREAIGFKESRSRYHIKNKFGYMGKYQFGKSTLKRLKIYNTADFLKNSEQQEKAFKALCSLNKHILRKEIQNNVGKKINGIEITESGILAAAHLGGAGSVKKFLRSNGFNNFSDAFGTSIQNYMKEFSGFDVSAIEANRNPSVS